ncbi:MAG: DUF3050 domain-containing protein [Myxococcota bacterium]|nr:DUF3050 domain-containing protein [Myxococcota bacterium]
MKIHRHPSAQRARYERLESDLKPMRDALVLHWVYSQVNDLSTLRLFMSSHIFAVWDFMSLLKTLQNRMTCMSTPWFPPEDAISARLVNEINLDEETDEVRTGLYMSHFELYMRAMEELGADRSAIETFLTRLRAGELPETAVRSLPVPQGTTDFVQHTLATTQGKTHEVAASFLFGREAIIPGMFREIIDREVVSGNTSRRSRQFARTVQRKLSAAWNYRHRGDLSARRPAAPGTNLLQLYLDRHVELDEGSHGPMAAELVMHLCGNDEQKWREATEAGKAALEARHRMWDSVAKQLVGEGSAAAPASTDVIDLASKRARVRSS